MKLNIGLVGYGEVGKTFAHGLDWNTQGAYFFSRVVQPDRLLAALSKAQP